LVEAAKGALVALQHSRVQHQPAAILGLDLARDDEMGVQLRVIGPTGRLAEPTHDQALGVGMEPAAVGTDAGGRSEPFQMRQHSLDGHIVRFREPLVAW